MTSIKYVHYAENHSTHLLKLLLGFRNDRRLTDIEICVGNETFNAHKAVLAASSPYFEAMFLDGLKESGNDSVHICGILPHIMECLLDFIYSGRLEITISTCQDLLAGADMLQLNDAVAGVVKYMTINLDPSNCIGVNLLADVHSCIELKKFSETYIHQHFLSVINEDEFVRVNERYLEKLLQSEELQVDNEFQVFEAAMKWICHDLRCRRPLLFEVLSPIRFPIISSSQLESYIANQSDVSIKVALSKLRQDLGHDRPLVELRLSRLKPCMLQPREAARRSIMCIGGVRRDIGSRWTDMSTLSSVHKFSVYNQEWTSMPSMKYARSGHASAVLRSCIYVTGGENDSLIYDSTECFDPLINRWRLVACMTQPRCGHGLVSLGEYLYSIGGWIGMQIGDTVERYDPDVEVWQTIDKVETPRHEMAVIGYQDLVYIFGGLNELGQELTLSESYNPITHEWLRLADMPISRTNAGIGVLNGDLYIVGGYNEDQKALNSVHKYSIKLNEWSEVRPLCYSRAGAGVMTINNLLYAMGGRTQDLGNPQAPHSLDSVECYDPQTDEWFLVASLPIATCNASLVVI